MVIQTFSKPKISKPFKVRKFQHHKIFQTPKIFQSLKTSKPDNFKVWKKKIKAQKCQRPKTLSPKIPKLFKDQNFKVRKFSTFKEKKWLECSALKQHSLHINYLRFSLENCREMRLLTVERTLQIIVTSHPNISTFFKRPVTQKKCTLNIISQAYQS